MSITVNEPTYIDLDRAAFALNRGTVILGVTASDSHAVANHLIAYALRAHGYLTLNLGTCTSVVEFAEACQSRPDVDAVVIGSLNGHAYQDLRDLPAAKSAGLITCPVVIGGNLSVGDKKDTSALRRLTDLGVDHVLSTIDELFPLLERICSQPSALAAAGTTKRYR